MDAPTLVAFFKDKLAERKSATARSLSFVSVSKLKPGVVNTMNPAGLLLSSISVCTPVETQATHAYYTLQLGILAEHLNGKAACDVLMSINSVSD
jgi:hypothetical protein